MRSVIVHDCATIMQLSLNKDYNNFSVKSPILGRLLALPVAVIDVAIDTFKPYLAAIEQIALVLINFFGAAFSKKCSLKEALICSERTFTEIATIPIKSMLFVPKIIFQFFAMLIHPQIAQSINPHLSTFKSGTINEYYKKVPSHLNAHQSYSQHAV